MKRSTPAGRSLDILRLTNGDHEPQPWSPAAEELLRAAQLAEAQMRSAAAQAASLGTRGLRLARARAMAARAGDLVIALAKRKKQGSITAAELANASSAYERVCAGSIDSAEVTRAEEARVAKLRRQRQAVERELEAAGSLAAMCKALVGALEAENARAQQLDNSPQGSTRAGASMNRTFYVLQAWQEQRATGAAVTTGEWRAAVAALADTRGELEEIEQRLKLGLR